MQSKLKQELLEVYTNSLSPPYFGGFKKWSEENIDLPFAYALPGKLDLSISPYLHKPMEDMDDVRVKQINLIMAVQVGKSLISELAMIYWCINQPGPIFRIFSTNDLSDTFSETRLIPLLRNTKSMKPLIQFNRFSIKKNGIILPHMAITLGGANNSLSHGMSVKYLLADEVHLWDIGMFNKFVARTSAFSGRRKIVVASQPNESGSELEKIYLTGKVYEWQWCCPKCKQYQPFNWSKRRNDDSFSGFNWDTILNSDGETTSISLSSRTTWLECDNINCKHRIKDTPLERRELNDNGKYVCIKDDGANDTVSYTCPQFVNVNITFESVAAQYMTAKVFQKNTGLDENMKVFVNQVLGKFYKAQPILDVNKIITEIYEKENLDDTWVKTMGVDVQRNGSIKYWSIRAWNKSGNESRMIDFGIARTWDEIESIRDKNKVMIPLVGVDSGDGMTVLDVYQACIRYGKVIKTKSGLLQYVSYCPLKGDGQKLSYKHKDGITRLYSEVSNQDCQFPQTSKYKGIPAPLRLWSNMSVKTILSGLRDNKIPNIKWLIDKKDEDYIAHLYSEGLREMVDKKTGLTVKRWMQTGSENHWFDCENMNLVMAMQMGCFSATQVNEDELSKIIDDKNKEKKDKNE